MINIKYYVTLTIKKTYGGQNLLIAGTPSFSEIYISYMAHYSFIRIPNYVYLRTYTYSKILPTFANR